MSYDGATSTKFGQYAVAELPHFNQVHFYRGGTLKEVDHEPPVPVLDQEDLFAQGIRTSELVPGAQDVDALGSCTCQAGTVSLAERVCAVHGKDALAKLGLSTTDAVANEKFSIVQYFKVTHQTGNPATEWPPTDCGSTGLFVCQEFEKESFITGHKSASGVHNVASLMQSGSVIIGAPWFNDWMTPDNRGFVDGDGTVEDLMRAISSGVAGGHETCLTALERLVFNAVGMIDLDKSWARARNSWSRSFGDNGSYRIHLSTLELLGRHADYKQFVVA